MYLSLPLSLSLSLYLLLSFFVRSCLLVTLIKGHKCLEPLFDGVCMSKVKGPCL